MNEHADGPLIEAVVFDLDGLMLNTEDVFEVAGRQMLARRGMQMTSEIHHSMLGRRPNEAFQAMKDLTGITDDIEDLKQETLVLFSAIAADHLDTMPGLLDLLDLIEEAGLPRAVATSSPREYMEDVLGQFELLPRFSVTLTAEDVTHGKPHPGDLFDSSTPVGCESRKRARAGGQRNRNASRGRSRDNGRLRSQPPHTGR